MDAILAADLAEFSLHIEPTRVAAPNDSSRSGDESDFLPAGRSERGPHCAKSVDPIRVRAYVGGTRERRWSEE
jgi:hypothetical protein